MYLSVRDSIFDLRYGMKNLRLRLKIVTGMGTFGLEIVICIIKDLRFYIWNSTCNLTTTSFPRQ